jgi:hypothetical protein
MVDGLSISVFPPQHVPKRFLRGSFSVNCVCNTILLRGCPASCKCGLRSHFLVRHSACFAPYVTYRRVITSKMHIFSPFTLRPTSR